MILVSLTKDKDDITVRRYEKVKDEKLKMTHSAAADFFSHAMIEMFRTQPPDRLKV